MKISNGIKIATANKPLCYKMLFSRVLITMIAVVGCFLFANIVVREILSSDEVGALLTYVIAIVKDFILGSSAPAAEIKAGFEEHLRSISSLLSGMSGEIVGVFFAILGVTQVAKFFTAICDYVIAVNVNEHMSSMRHAEFFTTLAEHIKPALAYALYCVILLFIYNVCILSFSVLLFFILIGKIGMYAVSIIFFLLVFTDALKFTVVGLVPAQMVCEKSRVWAAFKDSFKGLNFKIMVERFLSYFTLRLITIVITVVSGIVTFGVSTIITFPLFAVSYMAVRFVDYYTVKRRKYFITFDDKVIPKELRTDGGQLLNKVDID